MWWWKKKKYEAPWWNSYVKFPEACYSVSLICNGNMIVQVSRTDVKIFREAGYLNQLVQQIELEDVK